jgi:hypothetical protein
MTKEQEEAIIRIVYFIRKELEKRTPMTQNNSTRRFHWDTLYAEMLDQNTNLGYEKNNDTIKNGVLQRLVDNLILRKDGEEIVFTHE